MTPPLVVTKDETLLEELLRLSAAAGVAPQVARDAPAGLRGWMTAPLVLLGSDVAEEMAATAPPKRPGVHVVAFGLAPGELFRTALAVGAENVAELPQSETWVIEVLTDLADGGRRRARSVGVIGGSGGAGATILACALGQVAATTGPAVVIDLDPLGPGLDRVLGLEGRDGVRWDSLLQTTGRLSARSLHDALPRRQGLGVLSWAAGARGTLQPFAVREALSAARRGHDTVVVDLPRSADPLTEEVATRCDRVLVVVRPTVPAVASAVRTCARFPDRSRLGLVLRGTGAAPADIAGVTGVAVVATMSDQRGLGESIDLGAGPLRSRRGPLARAATAALADLARVRVAA